MVFCSVFNCKSRSEKKEPGITFHRFPVDPERRSCWLEKMKIKDCPTKNKRICSKHFRQEYFYRFGEKTGLLNGAIPTIFPEFPKYMQQEKTSKSTQASSSTLVEECQALQSSQPQQKRTSKKRSFNELQDDTPREKYLKKKLLQLTARSKEKTKKIRVLNQKLKRMKKKITTLQRLVKELERKNLISSENLLVLENMPDIAKELNERRLKKGVKYSPELRKFAVTLSFFSPKAYTYVRQVFDTCLPHISTIGKWFRNVDAEPGFTKESFNTLKKYVDQSEKPVILCLIIDEISIRKQIEWDGTKFHGYVNCGFDFDNDINEVAREAFVVMAVCLNGAWKLPLGYFFTNGLSGNQKTAIVTQCANLITDAGAHLLSLTFDGAPSNVTMARMLGCNIDVSNMKPYFQLNGKNVFIFFDPCHMVKLIRNTFGEKKYLKDGEGNLIKWEYIQQLEKLQETEGLHLGNKLRKAHLNFFKQKMKVRLAVQLLSRSVADALSYCEEQLDLSEFKNCQGTIRFINIINNVFDILNSHSLVAPKYKKALFEKNFVDTKDFIFQAIHYISNLKFLNNDLVIHSNRKTGFVGFICSMRSALLMYDEMVINEKKIFYLPLYKASQDHLEMYFSSIRSRGGWNNNPTCRQFTASYKRLLVRAEIREGGMGNCIPLEDIPILVGSSRFETPEQNINQDFPHLIEQIPNCNLVTIWQDHDYIMNTNIISECSLQIIVYIAGFVTRQLQKTIKCEECITALSGDKANFLNSLITKKDQGGLTYPSKDVIKICKITENVVRYNEDNLKKKNFIQILKSQIIHQCIEDNSFSSLKQHVAEVSNNHIYFLVEAVMLKYLNIRIHFISKKKSEVINPVRQQLTKLILFKNQ